jgi:hypothetical protein
MIGLPLTAVTALAFASGLMSTSTMTACSSKSSSSGSGSSSGGGDQAPACPSPLTAGTFPAGNCENSDESTCGTATTCPIAANCGATKDSCEPFTDNTTKTTWDLRMRRITIIAPKALANDIVQNSVVTHGVDLNLKSCGELGDGSFSWLVRFDTTTNTLTTGGGAVSDDPIGKGYCFVHRTSPDGLPLQAISVKMAKNAAGAYDSDLIDSINIPIYYLSGNTQQIIVLPIAGGAMKGLHFSNGGNCVGSIDTNALDSQCAEQSPTTCAKWKTDASIAGYITLEAADKVHVPLLNNKSLCVLLTGDSKPNADGTCERDAGGKIKFQGDYCSTTKSAGGCADSYWLAATFAASAVKITDDPAVPDCNGGTGGNDAGPDSAPASDAAPE